MFSRGYWSGNQVRVPRALGTLPWQLLLVGLHVSTIADLDGSVKPG
jgi:hypothetical protein